MKSIKIGKEEYHQIETLFDIGDGRFTVFKQHLLQVFEKMDAPLFAATFTKYVGLHNTGQHAEALIEWHNFKKATELKELDYDAQSFCYALLVLEKNEEQQNTSREFHEKKLERMRAAGLTRGQVEDAVENFMKASPKTFGVYLQMLELMKPQIVEEFSKD